MPTVMFLLLILGAVGLTMALPGRGDIFSRVGLVVLAAAGGVLVALAARLIGGPPQACTFGVCAAVALLAAVRVVTHQRPVYSALYFLLLIVAITALMLLMQAEFLATMLVLVYGGAILVTYVFVMMLAQQGSGVSGYDSRAREPMLACMAGFTLLAALTVHMGLVSPKPFDDADSPLAAVIGAEIAVEKADTVVAVGTPLLTQYVVGLEIVGVLLLAAMVGAIAIARRRPADDAGAEPEGDVTC